MAIERWTGDRPDGCPWRAFSDPIVQDVIRAYRYWETGQLAQFWGADPPVVLSEGVGYYHSIIMRIQHFKLEEAKQNRQKR